MSLIREILVLCLSLISLVASSPLLPRSYNSPACQQLQKRLGSKVSLPGSTEYAAGFIESCVLQPYCLFEPTSAADVATALSILTKTNTKFAVRGGGHMPVPEAASIQNGVLISTEKMNTTNLSSDRKIAQLGPGLRWGAIYDWISQYNLGVAGGRYDPVGVPGLLLGGGIQYFGSKFGWATDQVANFQVVLANSSIVDANAQTNQDLFWALKGGSSNFGIVTRFDVKTFPVTDVYGGTTLYNTSHAKDYLDAIAAWATPGGGSEDAEASINPTLQISPSNGSFTINTISARLGSDPQPAAFTNFTKIPSTFSDNSVRQTFSKFTDETSSPVYGDRSSRWIFAATGLKANADSVYLTNKTFFETMASMPELKKVSGLLIAETQQTITQAWLAVAQAAGGDAMGLDPKNGGFISFLLNARWDNAADDATVNRFAQRCIENLDASAKKADLHYPFVYLNDAAGWQKPFALYGGGASLPKMQAIAKKYDPHGVFQGLMPGGFKVF